MGADRSLSMRNLSIICFIILASGVISFAQSPLDQRVDFEVVDKPLVNALEKLIEVSGVNLNFSPRIIPSNAVVTLRSNGLRLTTVLDELLRDVPVNYTVIGDQIVLSKDYRKSNLIKTITGYVSDSQSGERIVGALVYEPELGIVATTNEFGFFTVKIPGSNFRLVANYLGYQPDTLSLKVLERSQFIEVLLKPIYLQEIVVRENPDSNLIETNGSGDIRLNMSLISKLASLGGEGDIFRIAYSLPGISTGADGFGGVSVKGGSVDQNLFLFDGVPIYNATHGIGIVSIFNTSAIKSARLIKSNFPAKYGGRLSSIWDVQAKEGNNKSIEGEADIGLSSGKITLQGPLKRGHGSWLVSGRRAFFDLYSIPISRQIRKKDGIDGFISYVFYDLNAKITQQLGEKNRLHLSFYKGADSFKDIYRQNRQYQDTSVYLGDEEKVKWGNIAVSLRWTHRLGNSAFLNTSAIFSRYDYESTDLVDLKVNSTESTLLRNVLLLKYNSSVQDYGLKSEMDVSTNNNHQIKLGAGLTRHSFQPGIIFFDSATQIDSILIDTLGQWNKSALNSLEVSIYGEDQFKVGERMTLVAGMRLGFLGVQDRTYFTLQPRLSGNYQFSDWSAASFSIGKVTQFLHLLSPTSVGLPKDLWVSATSIVPPQNSWQYTLGFHQRINLTWSLDAEAYFKQFNNLILFKGTFLDAVNATNWQDDVSLGKGNARGLELLLHKHSSEISGWFSYTLAWSERQFDKEINRGDPFPFRLDRRHSFDLQLLTRLNSSWELTLGFKFASGSAFTLPVLEYELVQAPGSPPTEIVANPRIVDQLNGQRMPAYHKLDLSFTKTFIYKKSEHKLLMGVTNIYNRKNPLYITLRDKFQANGEVKREFVQVSLLPIFPTLRYVISFR